MPKENYVSEEIENILVNDFIINSIAQNTWLGSYAELYVIYTRIFKYQIETNSEIKICDSLDLFLDNYKILKEKNLLSLEEIKIFEEFIKRLPSFNLITRKIENHVLAEEHLLHMCMVLTKYLNKSSFVKDFFHMQKNIENF